eukprot:90640-Pelagomonas_calceolata.AAC.3
MGCKILSPAINLDQHPTCSWAPIQTAAAAAEPDAAAAADDDDRLCCPAAVPALSEGLPAWARHCCSQHEGPQAAAVAGDAGVSAGQMQGSQGCPGVHEGVAMAGV